MLRVFEGVVACWIWIWVWVRALVLKTVVVACFASFAWGFSPVVRASLPPLLRLRQALVAPLAHPLAFLQQALPSLAWVPRGGHQCKHVVCVCVETKSPCRMDNVINICDAEVREARARMQGAAHSPQNSHTHSRTYRWFGGRRWLASRLLFAELRLASSTLSHSSGDLHLTVKSKHICFCVTIDSCNAC